MIKRSIFKRSILLWMIPGFVFLSCISLGPDSNASDESTTSSADRSNVIVIMTDEHNFRTLGCYRETMEKRQAYMWGPSVVETPNIDWIAKNLSLIHISEPTRPY